MSIRYGFRRRACPFINFSVAQTIIWFHFTDNARVPFCPLSLTRVHSNWTSENFSVKKIKEKKRLKFINVHCLRLGPVDCYPLIIFIIFLLCLLLVRSFVGSFVVVPHSFESICSFPFISSVCRPYVFFLSFCLLFVAVWFSWAHITRVIASVGVICKRCHSRNSDQRNVFSQRAKKQSISDKMSTNKRAKNEK